MTKTSVRRRVTPLNAFYESLSRIDGSQANVQAFAKLMERVASDPEKGLPVRDLDALAMKTHGFGPFQPLRVIYRMDEDRIYLLSVGIYGYDD